MDTDEQSIPADRKRRHNVVSLLGQRSVFDGPYIVTVEKTSMVINIDPVSYCGYFHWNIFS